MKQRVSTKGMKQRRMCLIRISSPQKEYQKRCIQSWEGIGSPQVRGGGGGALAFVANQNTTSQREHSTYDSLIYPACGSVEDRVGCLVRPQIISILS
jgi:hypothetical protein